MRRALIVALTVVAVLAGGGVLALWIAGTGTQATIDALSARVVEVARDAPLAVPDPESVAALPAPVRRYLAYTFPDGVPMTLPSLARITQEGQFRRPLTDSFHPMTARQTAATGTPAFVFWGTTAMAPGIWALAYDAFVDGRMEMKAKVLSALTVMEDSSSPALDRMSLRRWLLESPLFPPALLPGGPVRWEPIDDARARAVVSAHGMEAAMVAVFAPNGRLLRVQAEEDGDLTTPYHGSGEVAARDDDRLVAGMRIPHAFSIARAAGGEEHPFWVGTVTGIVFE